MSKPSQKDNTNRTSNPDLLKGNNDNLIVDTSIKRINIIFIYRFNQNINYFL